MSLSFPKVDPVAIHLGHLEVRWYALSYVFGVLFAYWHMRRFAQGIIPHDKIDELFTFIILGVLLGGRLGYVLFYNFSYYSKHIAESFYFWHGGMSFHGGLLGVIAAVAFFAYRQGLNWLAISDILACSTSLGIFFGRIANFINGELYGRITDKAWGVIFPHSGGIPRHPSQLYEALTEGLLLFVIMQLLFLCTNLRDRPGALSGIWLSWYAILRFFMEFYRQPDAHVGFVLFDCVSMGQLLSLPLLLLGIALFVRAYHCKRHLSS